MESKRHTLYKTRLRCIGVRKTNPSCAIGQQPRNKYAQFRNVEEKNNLSMTIIIRRKWWLSILIAWELTRDQRSLLILIYCWQQNKANHHKCLWAWVVKKRVLHPLSLSLSLSLILFLSPSVTNSHSYGILLTLSLMFTCQLVPLLTNSTLLSSLRWETNTLISSLF